MNPWMHNTFQSAQFLETLLSFFRENNMGILALVFCLLIKSIVKLCYIFVIELN